MNFYNVLQEYPYEGSQEGINPFTAIKEGEGEWISGTISIDFLNTHFGKYETAQKMIEATTSEGLKLFFQWLKDEGKLN